MKDAGIGAQGRLNMPQLQNASTDNAIPSYLWLGLLAPARTPVAVIDKLNGAVNEGLKSPEMRASIAKLGMEVRSMTARGICGAAFRGSAHLGGRRERIRRENGLTRRISADDFCQLWHSDHSQTAE
jgi:hypothetical protein